EEEELQPPPLRRQMEPHSNPCNRDAAGEATRSLSSDFLSILSSSIKADDQGISDNKNQ
ncbi:unnamed protein product, partial [Amoebophrya sp. A25]